MKKNYFYTLIICVVAVLATMPVFSQTIIEKDSIKNDSVPQLSYNFKQHQRGSLFLNSPSTYTVSFNKKFNRYIVVEKLGDFKVGVPIHMSPEEYKRYRLKKDIKEYFKEKNDALSKKKGNEEAQKNLLPTYYIKSKLFETVFGGNTVEVIPSGSLNIKLGGIYQNVDNPQLSENNRSSFTFDFDQQISASIIAKVGTRLELVADYDTQSTFQFQNIIKLDYAAPDEDDIIRKIEAGNVSMPIKNSLINGAQSLFGLKTELQFGKTSVTAVFSQQNSESKTVTGQAGASITPFELRATDYDDDRHFFLAQFFRENFKNSLKEYPLVNSAINITRIEVWVTNRNSNTENFRNIVALADIGEPNKDNFVDDLNGANTVQPTSPPTVNGDGLPTNQSNNIYEPSLLDGIRDIADVESTLRSSFNMDQGTDYSVLQNARKLEANEFTLNSQLGFISLNRRLSDGEVLAVAYEYTVIGSSETSFKVGELSNDGINAPDNLAVKLLRSEIITTKRPNTELPFPTWRLMMKNIYTLGVFPLSQDGFRFEIMYRDDETGIASNTLQKATTSGISNKTLLNVLNLDKLDQSAFAVTDGDGFFDYVEGVTVNSQKGFIIFPETEPFGSDLSNSLTDTTDKTAYVFEELYINTKPQAKNNFQHKDKFLLKGYAKSENSGGISLNSFNVPRGSVQVTAGGRQLVEGVDFVVDYQFGKVQIIDPGLQASGIPISVSTENNSVFNQQRKSFMGIDVEHRFSDKFILGGTLLNVNERPLTQKVNFGSEPINNTMFGLTVDYATEVPLFTKLVNKLPFVDTDVVSNVSVRADFAYLIPGSPSGIDVNGEATSYVDDFEASQIPIDLLSPLNWFTASTPKNDTNDIFGGKESGLAYNDKRAKLAWYSIDQIFYGNGQQPSNINNIELSRPEVRQVRSSELFPNTELDISQNVLIRTLDLAYFPSERGTYNFDTGADVNNDGTFNNPEERWGGIMRPLTTNNFDQANVEYIQFWIKDPYQNYSITNTEGVPAGVDPSNPINQVGELYFNLGNISEDILKDNRKMYENGMPADGSTTNTVPSVWGNAPSNQSILYAFDVDDTARENQDIGLDGLKNEEEFSFYSTEYPTLNFGKLDPDDIASDNFNFFRSTAFDNNDASIITRYKNFNNTEGNSPTANQSTESYPTSSSAYPDIEDINKDQTMNTIESYYEYRVSLNSVDLVKGTNNIVDEKEIPVTLPDGSSSTSKWYQFRIPVRSGTPVNGISDFNSIRFIRMFMTKFKIPVVVRFGQLELVRGDYRRYLKTLDPAISPSQNLTNTQLNNFEVGVVNIEQNEGSYVLPPGIIREQLQGTSTIQQQNEQSVSLKVTNLQPNETRAIHKNISIDLRMYKQLKMFLHAEPVVTGSAEDDDLIAIIRLGTDLDENFYQLEVPLKISPSGSLEPTSVWPEANNLEAVLETLGKLKLKRDEEIRNSSGTLFANKLYPLPTAIHPKTLVLRVRGNPTLAAIRTLMLGVQNISSTAKSAEIWFNELRSSGFNNKGGWATVISADANFADIATVSVTGRMQTIGFGNVEDRVNQRSLEETRQYDFSTSTDLGKIFTPKKWGIQVPMSYSFGEEFRDPKYDPQYQDVTFEDAKDTNPNSINSQDYTSRKSISFNNVKKNRNPTSDRKPKPYDIENFTGSYSFSEEYHKDYNIEEYINQNLRAGVSYNFTLQSKYIEPFKNSKFLGNSKYFRLIKDLNFNLLPSSIGINSRITRNFIQQKSRNLIADPDLSPQPTLIQRRFLFDWDYTIGFNLTKSMKLNFNANNSYLYDNFGNGEEIEIFDKFFNTGRPDHYTQNLTANYILPIDKIPYLDFLKADYGYTASFDWQATSKSYVAQIGNLIQNSNTHNLSTTLSFSKLYKNTKLKKLFVKSKRRTKKRGKGKQIEVPQLPTGRKINRKKKSVKEKILLGIYDVLTSVKTAKINYSENNGTALPGFKGTAGFLGRDNLSGGFAPTLGFVFGSQIDIRNKAFNSGWLVDRAVGSEYYNKTYSNTHNNKLEYTISLKPIKNLNIEIMGLKIRTNSLSQQLDVEGGVLNTETPITQSGNFSTSFSMLSTAFKDSDVLFQNMKDYKSIIANRLRDGGLRDDPTKFGSQETLLPAFLAAYSGKNPNSVGLGIFKEIPIPNWTLRYNGLMKLDWFKERFSNFTVTNGYKSSYTISNYTNNLEYDSTDLSKTNASGNYQSELLISSATIIDAFSPLIKIDVQMRSSFSFKGEIRRDRTLTMNFDNSTLTDIKGTEFIFGIGYRLKDVTFTTRLGGKKQKLKGDINMRADVSIRDNRTLIRSVDVDNDQITGGQKLVSIKLAADYQLNKNLSTSFYYNHNTSKYAISTTFPRQSINAGFNLIYNLGN